jgi:hypothetical protein
VQCLCALIILITSHFGFAQSKTNFGISHQSSSLQGSPSNSPNRIADREAQQSSITITSPMLAKKYLISTRINQTKNDYSSYILQNELGEETSLRNTFNQTEVSGQVGVDYRQVNYGLNLQRRQNLNQSPFSFGYSSVTPSLQFNSQLSQISLQYTFGQARQPISYFTDLKTAERKQRLTELDLKNYSFIFDHILTERIRGQIQFDLSEKSDRPTSHGLTVKSSVALSAMDFIKLKANQVSEQTQDTLKDDRGYFSLVGYEIQYGRYITYDLMLNLGYGLVVETEDNPQTLRKDRIATDVYSLKSEYLGNDWTASLSVNYLISNVDFSSTTFGGQFSWNY